jgi:hypothetical protein
MPRGNSRVVALDHHPPRAFPDANLKSIVQRHGLIDGPDFVETVGASPEDFKPQIDFGKSAESDGIFQGR